MWRPRSGGRIDAHTDHPQIAAAVWRPPKLSQTGPSFYAIAPMRLGEFLADEPAALLQSANTDFVKKGRPPARCRATKTLQRPCFIVSPRTFLSTNGRALRYVHLVLIVTTEPRRRP